MDGGLIVLVLGGTAIPFVSYGVAGVWKFWRERQRVDPKVILAERYARGEIDDGEYTRRLSMLTFGPPLLLPDLAPSPSLTGEARADHRSTD